MIHYYYKNFEHWKLTSQTTGKVILIHEDLGSYSDSFN